MFEHVTPESVGISSKDIQKYVSLLERYHLSTHSIVMLRHGKVFYENYWKPFSKDFLHRMYSVTKSFVGIAMGFLEQDGLIDLDAPAVSYLDKEITASARENIQNQTVRDMLMMSTGCTENTMKWFGRRGDRLKDYFDSAAPECEGVSKIPGAIFDYDSPGTFVMGAIAERITGKKLIDYLREKFLDKIGFSKEAYILSCPGGHSWTDSAMMCTAMDLARVCQFMLSGGSWNGEQILNREYALQATSDLISTNRVGHLIPSSYGYGYQIWQTVGGSFMFNGMGSQYGIGIPEKDIVFVINSDNQAHPCPMHIIIDRFFEEVVEKASDNPLPEDAPAHKELMDYSDSLELFSLSVGCKDNVASKVSGKEYITDDNPMGITKMKFTFEYDKCVWEYTNAQGDKKLEFGMGKNIYGVFPEEGYSDTVAATFAEGHYYKCASSASWTHPDKLEMLVQVIDKYFGRLHMRVAFVGEDRVAVSMFKIAEDFMNEYEGYVQGKSKF
ncbi:MAG: beta-lactamase family protein [Clostridia bacterium]|nr:beta-lactamase family protein [Clostridia bacterium]